MELNLDCIPCFQKQVLKALEMNRTSERDKERILRSVIKLLARMDWSLTPPEIAHEVHGLLKRETGIRDPYRKAKRESNRTAMKLVPEIRDIIERSKDPLKTAIRASIAGNIMDFGPTGGDFDIHKTLYDVITKDFAVDDYPRFRKALDGAESVLFFTDNAGEIVIDKLLIETMIEYTRKHGAGEPSVTVVVKGGPIINDATMEDARFAGMNKIPGVSFRTTDNGDPGTGPVRHSDQVRQWVRESGITISKGQGNYEGLSQFGGIFFLLIAKCSVIASDLGVEKGSIVMKHNRRKA